MGKRLRQQRRGQGSPVYRSPGHKSIGKISYRPLDENEKSRAINGEIINLTHSVMHDVPIAIVQYETGERVLLPANEGLRVGQKVQSGKGIQLSEGNVTTLSSIPDGTAVYNIELHAGDGGKAIRTSGAYGYIVSKEKGVVAVRMPSGKTKEFSPDCRATIGIPAGGGRTDKPLVKAGKMHFKMRARNHYWPKVKAINKNAVDHPFGGGGHKHIGRSAMSTHSTSPGRKVGFIAARRTGRKKK